jgi:hypothetical protein
MKVFVHRRFSSLSNWTAAQSDPVLPNPSAYRTPSSCPPSPLPERRSDLEAWSSVPTVAGPDTALQHVEKLATHLRQIFVPSRASNSERCRMAINDLAIMLAALDAVDSALKGGKHLDSVLSVACRQAVFAVAWEVDVARLGDIDAHVDIGLAALREFLGLQTHEGFTEPVDGVPPVLRSFWTCLVAAGWVRRPFTNALQGPHSVPGRTIATIRLASSAKQLLGAAGTLLGMSTYDLVQSMLEEVSNNASCDRLCRLSDAFVGLDLGNPIPPV